MRSDVIKPIVVVCALVSMLLMGACNDSDNRARAPEPARLHDNDSVTVNDDGTSSVVLANRNFTTSQFVMGDDGTANSTNFTLSGDSIVDIEAMAKKEVTTLFDILEVDVDQDITLYDVAIENGVLYTYVKSIITTSVDANIPNIFVDSFPDVLTLSTEGESEFNGFISISLSNNSILSSVSVKENVTGFSYNGALLVADGTANVDFYAVSNGAITEAFSPLKPLGDSGVVEAVFLDHDRYYAVSEGVLYSMPLDDVLNDNDVATLIDSDIGNVDAIYFSADDSNIYMAIVDGTKTKVQVIDKLNQIATDWPSVLTYKASGIAVDAHHVYLSDSITNKLKINAYLKNGSFVDKVDTMNSMSVGAIHIEDGSFFYIDKSDNSLHKSYINWAP